ncbi:unnamed protein product [Mucor hiemalis]
MLKEFGLSTDKENLLINAEASLDSAIKSATSIYPQQFKQPLMRRPSTASTNSGSAIDSNNGDKRLSNARLLTTKIRYKPDTKHILRKLNDLVRDLDLDTGKFFSSIGTTDDYEILQKAYVDLDIAKTISLSAKSNMKRRNILMRSARRRNNMEEIQMLGDKIREGVSLWMTYTRNTPLLINGEDIITILDREDGLLSKNQPIPSSRVSYDGRINSGTGVVLTPSTSSQTRSPSIRSSLNLQSSENTIGYPKKSTHSRSSSSVSVSDIPPVPSLPTTIPITPIASTAATIAANKKLYRQSAGPRLTQVKANIGLPRVRTTSITQQQQQNKTPSTPPLQEKESSSILTMHSTKSATPTSANSRQSAIPLPPSQQNTTKDSPSPTSNIISPDGAKKSLLKPPSQRGPGSTLRLRSMLAKRGQPAPKPPMPSRTNPE